VSNENRDGAGAVSKVDDLVFRYSMLTDTERRQFDRKYNQFRAVRRQFSGVFERMKAGRPERRPAPAEGAK
jgi:hypothetical protein